MSDYKIIVVGGGTAGLRIAIAASRKVKTLLIEQDLIGGTCLNTGCIPTKAMIYASHLFNLAGEMDYFGIKTSAKINFKKLMDRVNSISKEGRDHINKGLDKNVNLVVIKAKGKFVGIKKIKAGDKIYSAKNVIIATGAKNFVPPIKGLKETGFFDNVSILSAKKLPSSIVMIGGGYISMEYASFFSNLGVKVTVLERLPQILGMLDEDIRQVLLDSQEKQKIKVHTNINILEVKKDYILFNDVRDINSKVQKLKTQVVFLATGRVPNTNDLDLEKSKIDIGKRGEILVDDYLNTSCQGVYAIGDCNGYPMFAHSAKRQTSIAFNNIFSTNKEKMNFSLIPWATFSMPVVAGIGLSETDAIKQKIDYGIMKAPFMKNGRAKIIENQEGFVKILFNKKSRKIIGAVIVGSNADDIIHEIVALVYANAKVDVLKEIIHIHPTLSEVMDNLREVKK